MAHLLISPRHLAGSSAALFISAPSRTRWRRTARLRMYDPIAACSKHQFAAFGAVVSGRVVTVARAGSWASMFGSPCNFALMLEAVIAHRIHFSPSFACEAIAVSI